MTGAQFGQAVFFAGLALFTGGAGGFMFTAGLTFSRGGAWIGSALFYALTALFGGICLASLAKVMALVAGG